MQLLSFTIERFVCEDLLFVWNKSLNEVRDPLHSLTHRSPTRCIIGDNPQADFNFFTGILKDQQLQFSRDIFHVFQDLFRECLPSHRVERRQFMSDLWYVFFSLYAPDLQNFPILALKLLHIGFLIVQQVSLKIFIN